jgi:hypothetical protein
MGDRAMPNQAKILVAQAAAWSRFKALIGLVLVALAGCFGAPAMRYDIQEYNKQTVMSEQKMLLFNLGRLNQGLPPHFTMLATVSQSRTFTGTAGFKWSNPATWSSPFTATNTESPTIQFVPVQGQDFANRFESPLTDKFALFLEDRSWYATSAEQEEVVLFFAQSLILSHGDNDKCKFGNGLYVNRFPDPRDIHPDENQYYSLLSACVEEIVQSYTDYVQIDGSHPVPTIDSIAPLGADIVTALGAGYKWTGGDGKYQLTNPVRVLAWLDYTPKIVAPQEPPPPRNEPVPPVFTLPSNPRWPELTSFYVPKDYKPSVYTVSTHGAGSAQNVNVLVSDGYGLARDESGNLRRDSHGHYIAEKKRSIAHTATGLRSTGSPTITRTGNIDAHDIGSRIAGDGIPDNARIVAINSRAHTATMSIPATRGSERMMSVGEVEGFSDRFSYSDEVINDVWPVTQNYFYVELRKNETRPPGQLITDATAERDCFASPGADPDNGLVCGYFKIGNLLQIMQRLAEMACTSTDPARSSCSSGNFGIGYHVPSWADTSASFTNTDGIEEYVWVPAHNPETQPELADRDRRAFFTLYKLYQMSLVNTSQLVSGAPSITIPASK